MFSFLIDTAVSLGLGSISLIAEEVFRLQCQTISIFINHGLLRSSALAYAACQYWLTHGCLEHNAYNYYELPLQKLSTHLNDIVYTLTAAFFACLLLIAHCEMINASYQNWHLHLHGAPGLIATHKWHGNGGGLIQTCFWIHAP